MYKTLIKKRALFSFLVPVLAVIPQKSFAAASSSVDPYALSDSQGHYLTPALVYKRQTPPEPSVTPVAPSTISAPAFVAAAPPSEAPPAPIPFDWRGTYAGLQFGGGLGTNDTKYLSHDGIPYVHGGTTGHVGLSSMLGGFTVGHNEQYGNLVAGFETDFSINDVSGSANQPNPTFVYRTANPWLATFRPRLGYAFSRVMPYLTGGLAVGAEHISAVPRSGGLGSGSDFTDTELGWTAGGGVETALSSNWSIKAEYLYAQLSDAKGVSVNDEVTSTIFREHIAHVGLNYRFDQPSSPDTSLFSSSSQSSDGVLSLATLTGIEVGGQVSSYRYQEHEVSGVDFMHETGTKWGATVTATKAFETGVFLAGDTRFAWSNNHYSSPGSGTQSNIPDYLGEIRLLGGKDFVFDRFALSPYAGLGYRNLFNDLRGTSSLGDVGYRRDSQYFYMPVGVTPRFRITDGARISTTVEYDQLIEGWQKSHLTDVSSSDFNPTDGQYGGYGLRGSVMYERASWSMGPFFDYWNIDRSGGAPGGVGFNWFEPHNQTIDYGLQARYRF